MKEMLIFDLVQIKLFLKVLSGHIGVEINHRAFLHIHFLPPQLERNPIDDVLHQGKNAGTLATALSAMNQQRVGLRQQRWNQIFPCLGRAVVHGALGAAVRTADVVGDQLLQLTLVPVASLHREPVEHVIHLGDVVAVVRLHPPLDHFVIRKEAVRASQRLRLIDNPARFLRKPFLKRIS